MRWVLDQPGHVRCATSLPLMGMPFIGRRGVRLLLTPEAAQHPADVGFRPLSLADGHGIAPGWLPGELTKSGWPHVWQHKAVRDVMSVPHGCGSR